jgi:glycosyltransferase involved in cell wall biosynthesis
MKRVCFLIYNLEPGGLQHYLLRLIEFSEGRMDATLIVKNGKGGMLLHKFQALKVQVINVNVGHSNFFGWWKVFWLFKKGNFDSICDLTGNFGGLYLLLANLAGIKKRVAKYGLSSNHFDHSFFKTKYNAFVNYLVFKNATDIVTNSVTALNFFFPYRKENDPRCKVIFNGLDPASYSCVKDYSLRETLGIPANSFVIGNVGRFDPKKNQQAVLRLANEAITQQKIFHFIICGVGTEALMSAIKEGQLEKFVHVLGYRNDVPLVLRNFDAFYFPTLTEGQPNALIEALMCGLPIIASSIQPIREALPDFLYSQLIEPNDINTAYQKVLEIYDGKFPYEKSDIRNWAAGQFNHQKQFGAFFDCL